MPATKTASQRGTAARNKGAANERDHARRMRESGYFPEAQRSRDNGSATTVDTGDLAGTHPGLWWSLKNDERALTSPPGLIDGWMGEATAKAEGRIPLLVIKRKGHADPLRSWCWLRLADLVALTAGVGGRLPETPVRMELRHVLDLLAAAGYARTPLADAA